MSDDTTTGKVPTALTYATKAYAKPIGAAELTKPHLAETPRSATATKAEPQEDRRSIEETSEQLNKQMRQSGRDLSFNVDDVADKVVVTVKNKEGEVIRQIPSEVALRVAHNLENIKGLMKDEKS